MFLKLTDNETNTDIYLNPEHIIRFVPNPAGIGTFIYMTSDACVAPPGEPQVVVVHEVAEELFRMISRQEKPTKPGPARGLL